MMTRINRLLQHAGERYRSWRARREKETVLTFPYNNAAALAAYEANKALVEPDFEAYWSDLQDQQLKRGKYAAA